MSGGKQSGLGDNFYIAGYDLSGDVSAISQLGGGPATIDVTAINASASERIGGLRAGDWQFTSFWDYDSVNLNQAYSALSTLPRTDVIASYFRGTTLLNPCASINGRQLNYDPTRDNVGNLTMAVEIQSDAYGMEWGVQLTAGLRTDTAATVGSYVDDNGAGTSYGAQAYVQLVSFTGTSVTVTIDHCTTSGGSYSSLMATSAMTGIGAQRISVSNTTTVDRYLKVATTGTFTDAVFAVHWTRNLAAGQVF